MNRWSLVAALAAKEREALSRLFFYFSCINGIETSAGVGTV
jgi:hypothetical protein